jgi:uncharacterized protein (DUF433 family)
MSADILERELYSVREAARLLRLPPAKLRRWLDGAKVGGRPYAPVIREAPTGSDVVTWAEFVEAGFLREYRDRRVSLQHMRPMIDAMRRDFRVRYPLAHFKPAIDKASRQLVLEAQDDVKLDKPLWLVRRVGKDDGHWQTQWAEPMRQFLDKVDYDPEAVAQRMYPLGKSRRVVIDPEMVFGIPQVKGVRTETIAEALSESGDEEAIAETWGLELEDVKAAIQWEIARAA